MSELKNCKCGQVLDALHMGDIDENLCIICERSIVSSLTVEDTTLILWEGRKSI